jgi:hypothetical protein
MRLLIQSMSSGRFLVPCGGGDVEWVPSLKFAGGGVVDDLERALQLAADYGEFGEQVQLVDLDRLGTINDY